VIDEGEDRLGVLTLPGQADQTTGFLKSRIFFMDKVSVKDESDKFAQFNLLGNPEKEMLQRLGIPIEQGVNSNLDVDLVDPPMRVLSHRVMGWRLVVPREHQEKAISFLQVQHYQALSEINYEILRVESGIPAPRHELVEDYTPLEVGFEWAISDSKGCYTGQEVLARQVNYDKVTRQLTGLKLKEKPQLKNKLYAQGSNQLQGMITSSVISPRFGKIALAVVKRPYHQPGRELFINKDDGRIEAVTTGLPFE
jgi:folate-binding protein YgfZ